MASRTVQPRTDARVQYIVHIQTFLFPHRAGGLPRVRGLEAPLDEGFNCACATSSISVNIVSTGTVPVRVRYRY